MRLKKWFSLILFCFVNHVYANVNTPCGYWIQIDDATQKPHSLIKIYADKKDQTLEGKVIKGYSLNGKMPEKYCSHCKGALHNKQIEGMRIMWGFHKSDAQTWTDGKILDPNNGKIYSCQLTLTDHDKRLKVRGYIGFSLLGRTQEWIRQS